MVTFACREIREGGLIKFLSLRFVLAACESREDFLCFSEKRTRDLRAHRVGIEEARKSVWDFIFTRGKFNNYLVQNISEILYVFGGN